MERDEHPISADSVGTVSRLLSGARQGDFRAAAELLPLVYAELRKLARQRMAQERVGHTLQATALVHEAYLKLFGGNKEAWANQKQFFFAAAEAMRQILIDHARARAGLKRGGGKKRVPLSVVDLAGDEQIPEILALDEAISRLEKVSPDVAAVVRLRFYAGLSVEETAEALGISPRTVKREWTYARARLFRELGYSDA
jgi:RNA polymerase sigma factor (TIGR02999 family)